MHSYLSNKINKFLNESSSENLDKHKQDKDKDKVITINTGKVRYIMI